MAIIPTGYRVMVKLQKLEDVDSTYARAKALGIEYADFTKRKEETAIDTGTVVSLGSLAYKDHGDGTPWCAVGDLVAYARHSGKRVTDPETKEDFLVLNDDDICAVIKG